MPAILAVHKQQGAALLTALFIMAVITILVTTVVYQSRLLIYQSQLAMTQDQMVLDLQGVQYWAINALSEYEKQQSVASNASTVVPPQQLGPLTINGVVLTAQIEDQQARFNLNDLHQKQHQKQSKRFATLLRTIDTNLDNQQATSVAAAVSGWMNLQADDHEYLQLAIPYRSGHQAMVVPSMLRAVKGMTAQRYQLLSSYITVLPVTAGQSSQSASAQPININTAAAPVLMTLFDGMDLKNAQELVSCRKQHGWFNSISDFDKQCLQPLNLTSPKQSVTTYSQYFILHAQAISGQQHVSVSSLFVIPKDGKHVMKANPIYQVFES